MMTEAERLDYPGCWAMFEYARSKVSDRKLRLFGCACCRQIWHLITNKRGRWAIEVAERFADGAANETDLHEASAHANLLVHDLAATWTRATSPFQHAAQATSWAASLTVEAWNASCDASKAVRSEAWLNGVRGDVDTVSQTRREQAALLRHIVGNPFQPSAEPGVLPVTVVQLADALYAGEDCSFALHDALLEAGNPELADHFRLETWHPKGCWALDLILGKK